MTLVRYNIRLPAAFEKTLKMVADQQGVSVYAALQHCVKAGITAHSDTSANHLKIGELVKELASVSTRMVDVERLLDRALFTACAAYCYARSAASGERETDEVITAEINAAYERQRQRAQVGRS